jgi:hypothetical protein
MILKSGRQTIAKAFLCTGDPYYVHGAVDFLKVLHCKKRFVIFPSPAGMSLTKLSLGGNNDVIYKLFPPRESLVSDIPPGVGKIVNLFYSVFSSVYISSYQQISEYQLAQKNEK